MNRTVKTTISIILIAAILLVPLCMLVACDKGGKNLPDNNPNLPDPEVKVGNNFLGKSTASFENINGKTISVELFKRGNREALNNPNVGEAIMLYQCIKYKESHPEADVYATLTSFHMSVVAAVCLKRDSNNFGYMKSLYDSEYTSDGFVRISYLLVYAAKIGIHVTVVGQIDANGVNDKDGKWRGDYSFVEYFNGHLQDESSISGKTVGDFMTFRKANWTSYGDKSASDMMHLKTCTVSNYIDKDGVEHGAAVWLSSTNLDGITGEGFNGNDGIQTGVIVSDHEDLRRIIYNYTRLMTEYCGQEEIGVFRSLIVRKNTEQIDLIEAGRGNEIKSDEQIVYLGTGNDNVFEMYFTPLGGSPSTWDTVHNPYAKYISKLLPAISGDDDIIFAWNNVKYLTNFEFSDMLTNVLNTAFTQNGRLTNRLYLKLPGINEHAFDGLVAGENIGVKSINQFNNVWYHSKDFQLSYCEDSERKYVTVFNSLNFHQGSMSYQTNTIFVIKETAKTGNDVFTSFGIEVTNGVITEADRIRGL